MLVFHQHTHTYIHTQTHTHISCIYVYIYIKINTDGYTDNMCIVCVFIPRQPLGHQQYLMAWPIPPEVNSSDESDQRCKSDLQGRWSSRLKSGGFARGKAWSLVSHERRSTTCTTSAAAQALGRPRLKDRVRTAKKQVFFLGKPSLFGESRYVRILDIGPFK